MTTRTADSVCSILLFVGIAFASGCASFGPGLPGTPCPVALVPSQSIESEAGTLRARMQIEVRDEEIHLELIAEKRPDELVVVGLARFGVRLFAVHQRGTALEVEGASSFELEQVAIWVMDALHRAYWIEAPEPGDAAQEWIWHGEGIRQGPTDAGSEREFSLLGQLDSASEPATRRVLIEYLRTQPGSAGKSRSKTGTASIRNPWCGYEAQIVPLASK